MAVALNGPFTTIIVASLATFDLVAACYATSSNILGPISVLMQGLQPQLLVMVRDYRGERRRLFRHVVQAGVLLLAFTMTCAACVLWLPLDLGFALAGQSYRLGRPLLLPVAIALGLHGAIGVALACLRFHRSPQHMRNLRLIITGLSLGGLALGLWQAQMTGIIVAALATSAICTAMALMDLHMALRCGQLIEPHPLNSPNLARPKAHDRSSDAARASQSEILSCSPFEPMRRREGRANGRTR